MRKVTFASFFSICTCVIVCVLRTTSLNCANGNNKDNVVSSRTPCKGEKLFRVNERMVRAAGVNVGECLCIAHPDDAVRVNNRCSFSSSTSSEHFKVPVEIPRRLYHLINEAPHVKSISHVPNGVPNAKRRKKGWRKMSDTIQRRKER